MQPIGEALQKVMKMDLTSEVCNSESHELTVNGVLQKKEVRMMLIEGEAVCPICERDKKNEEMKNHYDEKFEAVKKRGSYIVFEKESILTDVNLLHQSFGSYEAIEKEEIANKEKATDSYLRYKSGQTFNTWFVGGPGVGKSHLAMSILRNLNENGERNKSCLFVSVDELLLRIRASFNDKETWYTEENCINLLSRVDYLVLDDLGAETGGSETDKAATDFTLRVLYAIANGRQDKSTIVTSNLTRPQLYDMYDSRLISRLMRDTHLIRFKETRDKRVKKVDF